MRHNFALVLVLIFLGCKTYDYNSDSIQFNDGQFLTENVLLEDEILISESINSDDFNGILFIRNVSDDDFVYVKELFLRTDLFENVFLEHNFVSYLNSNHDLSSGSLADLIGQKIIAKQIGNYLYAEVSLKKAYTIELEISIYDVMTGEVVFHAFRQAINNEYQDLNQLLYYPVFNHLIDWYKK